MAGNAPLSVTLSLVDKATSGLAAFANRIESTFKPLNGLKNKFKVTADNLGLPQVTAAFKGVKSGIGGVAKEVKALGKEFLVVGGLAAGIFGGVVYSTANAGDAAFKTAQKVGISTKSWSELSHAADMSGVQSEKLRSALVKLNSQAVDAANGNEKSAFWFRELGVDIRDQSGAIKSVDQLFADVCQSMSEMEDGTKKTGIAVKLLGDGLGPDLIPLLNAGKAGLADYAAEAARYGITITDEQGAAAAAFNDSMGRVRIAIRGIAYTIGNQLMPHLEPLVGWIGELIASNRELIDTKLDKWLESVDFETLKTDAMDLWDRIAALGESISSMVEYFGGWENVLTAIGIALAAVKLMPLVVSVITLTRAVGGLGIAFLSSPIGIVLTLAAGIYLLARHSELFTAVLAALGAALATYAIASKLAGMKFVAGGLLQHIPGLITATVGYTGALWAKVAALWAGTKASLALAAAFAVTPIGMLTIGIGLLVAGFIYLWNTSEGFRNFWINLWDRITGYLSGAVDRIKAAFDEGIIQGIYAVIKEFSPTTLFKAALDGVFSMIFGYSMEEAAQKVGESILSGFKGYFPNIFAFFDGIFEDVKKAFDEGLITGLITVLWKFSPLVFFAEALDAVVKYFTGGAGLYDAGEALMSNLWSGIKNVWADITKWFDEATENLTGWMPDFLKEKLGLNMPKFQSMEQPAGESLGGPSGPPAGAADMIREQATINNNSTRDAHVTLDLKNVPQGAEVETSGIEQVSRQQDNWNFVMNGGRMASF
jgi:phage tail tape measure protein, TP901 family, core region